MRDISDGDLPNMGALNSVKIYMKMSCFSKRIVLLAVLALISGSAHAQDYEGLPTLRELKGKKLEETLTPSQHPKTGLWGYVGSEGKFIIRPVFSAACPYEKNIARIAIDGKWGTISDKGLYLFRPRYDKISPFTSDSLAIAELSGKEVLIDTRGLIVRGAAYDAIVPASYGYWVKEGSLYGTLNHTGAVLMKPQFVEIEALDSWNGKTMEHIFREGKWGVLSNGVQIISLGWDKKLTRFQGGVNGGPDLFLANQGGKVGVVALSGEYVVPCIYDNIEDAPSGEYYITELAGRYGALSKKMVDFIPPVLAERPFLGENILKVSDGGEFFCANVKGCVKFEDCADLYSVFKPEEYLTTKYFPQWAKTHINDENVLARQSRLDKARQLLDGNTYAESDAIIGLTKEKYGIAESGLLFKSSGNIDGLNILYKASDEVENNVYFLQDPSTEELYFRIDDVNISVNNAIEKFNIKENKGLYPKGYTRVSDNLVLVHFAFVGNNKESVTPLIERNPYLLPVDSYDIKAYTGIPNSDIESHAVMKLSIDSLAFISVSELQDSKADMIMASQFGGFYICNSEKKTAEVMSSLKRYDRNGLLDWEYVPMQGDVIFDVEETENFIYLCGSTRNGIYSNNEMPLLVKLSKRGKEVSRKIGNQQDTQFTGIVCRNYLLYTKMRAAKGNDPFSDLYYPAFNLEDMGDNVGVRLASVWTEWGEDTIGGLGLTDELGNWLHTPALSPDVMHTVFDWEFCGYIGDYAIVRHLGLYGLVNRSGEILVDAKYTLLEQLSNPNYFRASLDGKYGVIDSEGNVVVPFEYSYVGNMKEDIIVVRDGDVYGCYNKLGKLIVPLEYEEIREYVGGMARIRYKGRFGFIDNKGEILVAPFSDDVENFSEGCALVTIKDKCGFVNLNGDWIVSPMYDSGSSFSQGLAMLSVGGKCGYIDKTGNFVIPMKYSVARDFDAKTNLACVALNNKWGVIDLKGNVILPIKFDEIVITSDGYLYVRNGSLFGLFDLDGKEVFPVQCDAIEIRKDGSIFRHGTVGAMLKGQRIRIDKFGNVIHQYSLLK